MKSPLLCSVAAAVVFVALGAVSPAGADQEVTVNIAVRDESGQLLPQVPLEIHTARQARFLITGENGLATTLLMIDPDNHAIILRLHDTRGYDIPGQQAHLAIGRYLHYVREYFCRHTYKFPIVQGQVVYDIGLVFDPAIKVTFAVQNQPALPIRGLVFVRDGASFEQFRPGQPFTLGGVPEGKATELYFTLETSRLVTIPLTAEQTQTDIDLGEILLDNIVNGDAVVDISVTNGQDLLDENRAPIWRSITLVRVDGEMTIDYPVDFVDTWKVVETTQTVEPFQPPTIPAGTYYIAPGVFGTTEAQLLYDLVRAGRFQSLEAHSVPKIVAISNETVQFNFDAAQAKAAIIAAGAR